jgi:methylthioribose-1-phosphate isomerase
MPVPTVEWKDDKMKIVDQTKLPGELVYLYCSDVKTVWEAIKSLRVRGAPAIGVSAALGTVVGMQKSKAKSYDEFYKELLEVTSYLATSRPTAVNLFWALERMKKVAEANKGKSVAEVKKALLKEALAMVEEDKKTCSAIGENGAKLVADGWSILTHCNAGGLATAEYGTALAVIFTSHEQGKKIRVYADETRPLLQGARLTTWELMQAKIEVTLICDNMAASVMKEGKVNCVIVGADRIAANGDTANKIGTYGLGVLAKEHGIPFYVAAPVSTFDMSLATGDEIPIEERDAEEVTSFGNRRVAPEGVKVYNPAFDVTPAALITAIITEKGIIEPPYGKNIVAKCKVENTGISNCT